MAKLKNKQLGIKFRRQCSIGYFIVDFCSPRNKLIIEVEGAVHDQRNEKEYDAERWEIISDLGFKIIRLTNEEIIHNIDIVLEKIKNETNL